MKGGLECTREENRERWDEITCASDASGPATRAPPPNDTAGCLHATAAHPRAAARMLPHAVAAAL